MLPLVQGALGEPAIDPRDDTLAAHHSRKGHDALGDGLGMFHYRGRVRDDAGYQDLALRQLDVLPDSPFVRMARRRRFHGVGLSLDTEQEVHDVAEAQVVDMRTLPAAPAEVVAHSVLGD